MSSIGPESRKQLKLAARFASAGLELVVAIVVGYFGGRALDSWFETTPVCSYVGLILGIVAGFRNLFLLARSASEKPPEPSQTIDPKSDHSENREP